MRLISALFALSLLFACPDLRAADGPPSDRLMIGAGYPDLRLRSQVLRGLDLEAKLASDGAVMAYSGRLYWRAWGFGAATLIAGAEGGAFSFGGVEGLDGSGSFYQPFLGLQARFARRWSAQLDAGPAFMSTQSAGISVSSQPWVMNAALYFSIF